MQIRRSLVGTFFPILSLVFALSPLGHAVVPNRIASVATEARTPLQNTVSPRAKSSVDLGTAPGSLQLNGLMLQFNMTAAQQAALKQLLAEQQNPQSAHYHQWLTPQQYGEQFGLSADDIAHVTSWLTAQGFTVTGVAKSSNFVTFNGTAAQVQHAFGTTVHSLSLNGERHVANLTDPVLPSAIAKVVSNISGLNDFRPEPHLRIHPVSADAIRPHFTVPGSNPAYHALAPADFNTIYDVNPLITSGLSGAGIGKCTDPTKPCGDIAVLGQVDITPYAADLNAFRTAAGLPPALPEIDLFGANPGSPSSACTNNSIPHCADLEESMLDVEWAGAIAPAAKIVFVTSTNAVVNSFLTAVAQDVAPIISMSYGQCESSIPFGELQVLNATLLQASVQGMTIIGPTGDDGATDCDTLVSSATKGFAVDFPGSSPYVTGIGGTMFDEGANSAAYWNSTNDPINGGSAIKHIPETVWDETSLDIGDTPPSFGAGGGGASILFVKPEWQVGNGVPDDGRRDVPDISLNSASKHDGYLLCLQNSCTGGQFYNTTIGNGAILGGTSAATPPFAGIMALVEESLASGRLGNINPNIYAMANSNQYNAIFHDITSGNNASPCTAGTKDCPSGGSIGFIAVTGYDQASGWGSIDATVFAQKWTSFPPTAPGLPIGSTTVVTATPNSVAAGTPVSLAITVASVIPNLPYPPTGTVQIQVDGTAVGGSVALASGQAGGTLSTTGLTVGQHTVTVTYSGDSNFNGSSGTTIITITGTGAGGTIASQTSVIATPGTVAVGTAISLAITVAPGSTTTNTPTGAVQIQVDGATVATSTALSNGHASYLLGTSGLAAGTHTVTVIYSGDANFNGSQGTANITITVVAAGSDFTITPSTASVSTIVGEKVPSIVFTLTPVNGFTGPITLTASDISKDGITSTFSADPVVINSTSGVSTTLSFKAFQSLTNVRGQSLPFDSVSNPSSSGKSRWYVAGSGATLACLFLLVLPRRRRWGALLAILLSVGAIGASGCGSGGTLPTDATYNVTITATAAGNLSHAAAVKVTFRIR